MVEHSIVVVTETPYACASALEEPNEIVTSKTDTRRRPLTNGI
jgi:hypothetical protein